MDLLTAEEIAVKLHLRPSTIKRWMQERKIPCIRLSGTVVRFDWDAVVKALQQKSAQAQGGEPDPGLIYPDDVDRRLSWHPGTARRLALRGKLPRYVLPDGEIRFKWNEIEPLTRHIEAQPQGTAVRKGVTHDKRLKAIRSADL